VLYIESLEINDNILDKIESKHGITFSEVEEACLSDKRHVRKGKEGLYKLFSQTDGGRYILIVLLNLGNSNWNVVTAREMTDGERQLYKKSIGGK
jgi:uncharacterized DUF497 family protein